MSLEVPDVVPDLPSLTRRGQTSESGEFVDGRPEALVDAWTEPKKAIQGPLAELIARSVIDNLHRFVVPNIAGPARLVPLASLVTETMSYEVLRQAARRGRLEAEQGSDGVWRSSRKAVTAYERSRFSRSHHWRS